MCTRYTLHTLSILQHVSAHNTWHFQEVSVVIVTLSSGSLYSLFLAQQPPVGHDIIHEVSRSHTATHHSR